MYKQLFIFEFAYYHMFNTSMQNNVTSSLDLYEQNPIASITSLTTKRIYYKNN